MYAYQLQRVDDQYNMHIQAWINHQVTSTKEQGKKQVPVYKEFKDFFDYEKQIKGITGNEKASITDRQIKLARIAKRLNERG